MKMQSAVEEYLVEIEVRKYTPKTIRSYRCNLNLFLRFAQRNCTLRLYRGACSEMKTDPAVEVSTAGSVLKMVAIGEKEAQVQVQPPSMTTLLPVM